MRKFISALFVLGVFGSFAMANPPRVVVAPQVFRVRAPFVSPVVFRQRFFVPQAIYAPQAFIAPQQYVAPVAQFTVPDNVGQIVTQPVYTQPIVTGGCCGAGTAAFIAPRARFFFRGF